MVEKIIRKTPEEKNSNGFKRVKLLASVALAGTLAACGSREESAPGIPSAGGAVGSAGATSGGSTTGGAANAGGTTSSGGSTQAGGNAGEAEGGAPACPVNVEYNLSCDSLSSVPKTMVVGEEVNLGVSNGAIVVRLAEITGRNFDTAQWHASNETCDQYQISISEGQSSDLWVATNVVNVRVNEISPDPVTQVALVNVVFSAVCEGGAGGSAGEGGTTSGAGGQATGGTGNSAGIGGSSGEAGVGGISGSAGMSGAGGATGGVGGVSGAGGATGGVGGVSGAGGATSGAGGQETGGAGGSVTSGVCEGVKRASVVSELIAYQSPYTLGGYTLTYVGSSSENSIDMSIECASTGESLGSVVAPYARIGSDQFGTFADSVNNMGVSVQVHSYSAGAARISVNVTSQ